MYKKEFNHHKPAPTKKVQATGAEGSGKKMSAEQVSISEYAIGHLVGLIISSNTCTYKYN